MRRRTVLVLAGVTALGVAVLVIILWASEPAPGVTEENARRLRFGMSRARVERILGRPGVPHVLELTEWEQDGLTVVLRFEDDVLTDGYLRRGHLWAAHTELPLRFSPLERLRELLPL